jgi:hypothetical protein
MSNVLLVLVIALATLLSGSPVLAQTAPAVEVTQVAQNGRLDFDPSTGFAAEGRCFFGRTTFSNQFGWSASGLSRACGVVATYQWQVTPTVTVGPVFGVNAGGGSYTDTFDTTFFTSTYELTERGSVSLGVRGVWAVAPRWTTSAEIGGVLTQMRENLSLTDPFGTVSFTNNGQMRGAYAQIGVAYRASNRLSVSAGVRHQRTAGFAGLEAQSTTGFVGAAWRF